MTILLMNVLTKATDDSGKESDDARSLSLHLTDSDMEVTDVEQCLNV